MSKRKKQIKKYSDPFGRNKPLQAFQGRCKNKACSIAVFDKTLKKNNGLCPFCSDIQHQQWYWKERKEEQEKKEKKGEVKKSRIQQATELLSKLTLREKELLLSYIDKKE